MTTAVWCWIFGHHRRVFLPEGRGLVDVKDGFWVDGDCRYTQGSDARWWVPPSQITLVEKI